MHRLLWVLQSLAAVLYGASGVMKVFFLAEVREGVPSFDALPSSVWVALGLLELVCAVGLVLPAGLRWWPKLTVVAATLLALESLIFIGVHVKYQELVPTLMMVVLGLAMAFIAYGRAVLRPIRRETEPLRAAA